MVLLMISISGDYRYFALLFATFQDVQCDGCDPFVFSERVVG